MLVYKILTNLVVLIHLLFILYVVFGALLAFRWKRSLIIHIPAVIWGVIVEYMNLICPLTPLENYFRKLAGYASFSTGFIDHYLTPVIYPENLEQSTQIFFGSFVVIINILAYTLIVIIYNRKSKNKNIKHE